MKAKRRKTPFKDLFTGNIPLDSGGPIMDKTDNIQPITRLSNGVYRIRATEPVCDYDVRCSTCEYWDDIVLQGTIYRTQHPIQPWFDIYLEGHELDCGGTVEIHITQRAY